MKRLFLIVFVFIGSWSFSQDSIVSLDVLSAPQSPAANLMGFTESEILKPESPTDFMTNIKTASGGFSAVPNSFAIDLRMKNLFNPSEDNSFSDYIRTYNETTGKSDVWNNVKETAIFSVGYQNYSALKDTFRTGQGFGLGFKASLLRGKQLDAKFQASYDSLVSLQKALGTSGAQLQQEWKSSQEYQLLRQEMIAAIRSKDTTKRRQIEAQLEESQNAFVDKINEENIDSYEKMRKIVEGLEFKTYGFVWDIAAGLVLDFPSSDFDYSLIGNTGFWTTFGYETPRGFSFLGMGRALYKPELTYTNAGGSLETSNVANYDFGGRILYEQPGKSFSMSAEGIYRGTFNNAHDPMYRLTLNVGYEVYRNMKLTFIFGRDYDGVITREGTVISALQFVMGLGSNKNLNR